MLDFQLCGCGGGAPKDKHSPVTSFCFRPQNQWACKQNFMDANPPTICAKDWGRSGSLPCLQLQLACHSFMDASRRHKIFLKKSFQLLKVLHMSPFFPHWPLQPAPAPPPPGPPQAFSTLLRHKIYGFKTKDIISHYTASSMSSMSAWRVGK